MRRYDYLPGKKEYIKKNTVQALKYPSADAVTMNVHKSETSASNALCQ